MSRGGSYTIGESPHILHGGSYTIGKESPKVSHSAQHNVETNRQPTSADHIEPESEHSSLRYNNDQLKHCQSSEVEVTTTLLQKVAHSEEEVSRGTNDANNSSRQLPTHTAVAPFSLSAVPSVCQEVNDYSVHVAAHQSRQQSKMNPQQTNLLSKQFFSSKKHQPKTTRGNILLSKQFFSCNHFLGEASHGTSLRIITFSNGYQHPHFSRRMRDCAAGRKRKPTKSSSSCSTKKPSPLPPRRQQTKREARNPALLKSRRGSHWRTSVPSLDFNSTKSRR